MYLRGSLGTQPQYASILQPLLQTERIVRAQVVAPVLTAKQPTAMTARLLPVVSFCITDVSHLLC